MTIDRVRELCAGAVLADLDGSEQAELRAFEDQEFVRRELAAFERAGAEIAAFIGCGGVEPMPAHLRARVARSVEAAVQPVAPPLLTSPRLTRSAAGAGWVVAAAASLLAGLAWLPRGGSSELPIDRQRLAFQTEHPSSVRLPWERGCSGEVLWSPDAQSGFLTLRDLPANDPSQFQYQLWIFDRERDTSAPVDGGVFDVTTKRASAEVLVPIRAKLRVHDAFAFVITRERPGGVVVSEKRPDQIVAVVGL